VFAGIDCLQRRPGLQFAIIARRRIDFILDLLRHRHGLILLQAAEYSNPGDKAESRRQKADALHSDS